MSFPPPKPGRGASVLRAGLLAVALATAGTGCSTGKSATTGTPRLYGADPGAHRLVTTQITVTDPARPRDIPVRVVAPEAPGRYPVVLFFHGARCYPQGYGPITDHWASHGYIIVFPDHLDSPNNAAPPTPAQMGQLLQSRVDDAAFLRDHLAEVLGQAGVADRGDTAHVAVAGHSFGALIAMTAAGLPLPGVTREIPARARPAAVVTLSGVGAMPEIQLESDAFTSLTLPLIATGGTLDVGNTGGPEIHPWEWRLAPYALAPAGDKYQVVLASGDHYLGGLICRSDRGGPKDPEGAHIDAALTLAFLDAYLKDDDRARRFLATADVPGLTAGRARFDRK